MSRRPIIPALAFSILILLSIASFSAQAPPAGGVLARADSLQVAGQVAAASALVEEAIPSARAAADTCLLGGLLHRHGFYALSSRDPAGASVALEEAVVLASVCGDSAQMCASLRWLGRAQGILGRNGEAADTCRRLVEVGTTYGDRINTGWGHVGLGWHEWRSGHADPAIEHYEAAVAQFEGVDAAGEAWALNGIALILDYQGRLEEAVTIFRRNLALARKSGDQAGLAMALNNVGSVEFSLGRPDVAFACFQEALEINRANEWVQNDYNPMLNVALCQLELGRVAEAESTLAEAQRIGTAAGDQALVTVARLHIAELYAWTGRPHAGAGILEEALKDEARMSDDDRTDLRFNLALAYLRMGDHDAALAMLDQADAAIGPNVHPVRRGKVQAARGWTLLEMGRPGEAVPVFRGAVASALEMNNMMEVGSSAFGLGLAFEKAAETDSAIAWYERTIELWEGNRNAPEPADWRVRVGSLARDVFPALALLLADRGQTEEAADRIQAFKARTLLERMLGPGKRLADHVAAGQAAGITMARLQGEVLKDGELLLDYYMGREASLVLAVSRDTLAIARLPRRDDLTPRLVAYHSLLEDPDSGSAATVEMVGRALGADLQAEFGPLIAASDRILVSPDEDFNLLPFGEWQGPPGGPSWVRIPSASFLASVRKGNGDGAETGRILAILGTSGPEGTSLVGPEREINQLRRRFAAVDEVRPAAADLAGSLLAGCDVLHIAAHARTVDQSPWNSAILVDTGQGTEPLRASAIADLDLEARLAVLSSCNTAAGRIVSGEGVMGLTSAFFSAGVPTVVASLWAVDDAVTAELMLAFYDELAQGRDVATALAGAQGRIRENTATAHPAYWAGFVVAGDGSLVLDVTARAGWPASRTALIAGVVLIVLLIVIRRPRRRT